MESSVTELMQNLKRLEDLTNFQMNELASVRQETLSVKWKLTRYSDKSKELESALNSSRELLSSNQFNLMLLEHREKTLKEDMLPEKIKAMETERSGLEQLHSHIWQARKDFCEKAREFNKREGFLGSNCHSNSEAHEQANPEFLPKVTDDELDLLVAEIASLEKELLTTNSELFTLNEKLASANNEIEMLTNEPTTGVDFIRLQEARAYCQNQVDLMESRCKKVKDEINSNEKILQSLTLERRASEAVHHDYANTTRNRHTNQSNHNVTQEFSTKKIGSAKLDEELNKTIDLETNRQEPLAQFRKKTPSKVTFARNDQYVPEKENELAKKLLARAENRIKEMQAARDTFLKMKSDAGEIVKTGVTADWYQARPALPKASITENFALRNSEIPQRREFMPKQQSAVAGMLGASNKPPLSYENKESSGNVGKKLKASTLKCAQPIPTKPTRDKVTEFESTAEPSSLPREKPEQPRTSILKPPSRMPYIS